MENFIVIAKDKKNSKEIRLKNRKAHLDYIQNMNKVNIKIAGPLLENDKNMKGSMLIIEANDIEEINDFLKNDPYNKAGLFESISIDRFILVIGD